MAGAADGADRPRGAGAPRPVRGGRGAPRRRRAAVGAVGGRGRLLAPPRRGLRRRARGHRPGQGRGADLEEGDRGRRRSAGWRARPRPGRASAGGGRAPAARWPPTTRPEAASPAARRAPCCGRRGSRSRRCRGRAGASDDGGGAAAWRVRSASARARAAAGSGGVAVAAAASGARSRRRISEQRGAGQQHQQCQQRHGREALLAGGGQLRRDLAGRGGFHLRRCRGGAPAQHLRLHRAVRLPGWTPPAHRRPPPDAARGRWPRPPAPASPRTCAAGAAPMAHPSERLARRRPRTPARSARRTARGLRPSARAVPSTEAGELPSRPARRCSTRRWTGSTA